MLLIASSKPAMPVLGEQGFPSEQLSARSAPESVPKSGYLLHKLDETTNHPEAA